MISRTRFDLQDGQPFVIDIDGEQFGYTDCYEYAVIADMRAGVHTSIFKSRSGRFAKVTTIAEEGADRNPYGIDRGWYSAVVVSEEDAKKIRSSWAILRDQPPAPGGPWA